MENFVTLFNIAFLPQGLALHMSMERNIKHYILWIICIDDETFNFLEKLALSNVKLLKISNLETKELLEVKPYRTTGEYCWTLTPFAPSFIFESDTKIKRITYIDADIWFRKNPDPIFFELNEAKKSVLITDHAYDAEFDSSSTSGQFCVQFMIFDRENSTDILHWWQKKCIEWCYAVADPENTKYGDQKYLDLWPVMFKDKVHVLSNKELILGPWNAMRFPYGNSCVWHFHGSRIFRFLGKLWISKGWLPIPRLTWKNVYLEYHKDIKVAVNLLNDHGISIKNQINFSISLILKDYLRLIYYRLWAYKSEFVVRIK
jgi:hypothetical protein